MSGLQQPYIQIGEFTGSASEAENYLDLTTDFGVDCDLTATPYQTSASTQSSFQDGESLYVPTHPSLQGIQLAEFGIFTTTCDPPMAFRDRHRFLHETYNSYPDPTHITAEDMGEVAQRVGLLMDEVLAWFKDEKSRRVELLANHWHHAQVTKCQYPPSPGSTRTSGEMSSTASLYTSTSPGTPSQPPDMYSQFPVPSEDSRTLAPPKPKRGRPAKGHIKEEPERSSPDSKRRMISIKYPCPDCGNFVSSERFAEHINRKHFPETIWECHKINKLNGKPCSSSPHFRPFYRADNFITHLKGEHKCSESEVVKLKKTCKYEVFDLFHKICGFCNQSLESRDESIEHIKDHFRKTSHQPNPPADLGLSQWKDRCGFEHKLQRGIHYQRNHLSEPDPTLTVQSHDYDDPHGENTGGSSEGNPNPRTLSFQGSTISDQENYCNGSSYSGSYNYGPSSPRTLCDEVTSCSLEPRIFSCSTAAISLGTSSAMSSSHSIHGQVVPVPEWSPCSPSLPPIASYDSVNHLEYNFNPRSMGEFALDFSSKSIDHFADPSISHPRCSSHLIPTVPVDHGPCVLDAQPDQAVHPYLPPPRLSHPPYSRESFTSEVNREKSLCTCPDCGKVFKDLKAHMLTHQNERPEKCPIKTCEYHIKGFARKYDKNRHILTHYKETMVCSFCPGGGSLAKKSFNRADVFKRHLTSTHGVEQMSLNGKKTSSASNVNGGKKLSGLAPEIIGKCSTCSIIFGNAQDFYDHLDDCVLRIVQQETHPEPINVAQSVGVESPFSNT